MYKIDRQSHEKYGNLIVIERSEDGELSPFKIIKLAIYDHHLWKKEFKSKIRFMIDKQILTTSQIRQWASEEYKSLPKCASCVQILAGQVYTHSLCGSDLFCSQPCADISFRQETDKLNDEEEIEYL